MTEERRETVNHPRHYGGEDNPYEAIKVIEDWGLGFCLGNALKYILRAKHKGTEQEDLQKALWYLNRAKSNNEICKFYFDQSLMYNIVSNYWKLSVGLSGSIMCISNYNISQAIRFLEEELKKF
jgi:hypothetical protein